MFKRYQPAAPDLTIAVGNAHGPVNRMALYIGTHYVLDAVAEPDVAIYGDAEIGDGYFRRAPEVREEIRPIPAIVVGAPILFPGHDVKNDEVIALYIVLHDCIDIAGIEGGCKSILERPDRCFIRLSDVSLTAVTLSLSKGILCCHILSFFSLFAAKELDACE